MSFWGHLNKQVVLRKKPINEKEIKAIKKAGRTGVIKIFRGFRQKFRGQLQGDEGNKQRI